tara:strand:- start:70 stop:951 length:882 start_codon:yes stop_codon:yes gene_type:complete
MIIDTHVWVTKAEHWGDWNTEVPMDDSMIHAGWNDIGKKTGVIGVSPEKMLERMDEAGVDKAVMHAIEQPDWNVKVPNEYVANVVDKYPNRFIGMGCTNLLGGTYSLKEMEEIKDLGLVGMKIAPAPNWSIPLNDAKLFPIYEKAQELDFILQIHTGWSGYGLLKDQHPLLLDEISVKFPDLKIVVVHAGENYYEEVVMMMLKNRNMYAGTGWWGYIQPLETNIRFLKYAKHFKVLNKVFWGTDNYDCRDDVPFVKSFPKSAKEKNIAPGLPDLDDNDISLYLGLNAAKLLKI